MKLSRAWLWLLLLIPLAVGIDRLRFDAEILNLLPAGLPVAEGVRSYQEHFANARELIITVEAATAEETESTARALAAALRAETNLVAGVTWQPAWMEDPVQAMELLAYLWLNQPPPVFAALGDRLAETNLARTLGETRARLATSLSPDDLALGAYDPFGLTRLPETVSGTVPSMSSGEQLFASEDGTFRVLYVEARPELAGYRACQSWLENVRKVIAEARRAGGPSPAAEIHFTGRPAFVVEVSTGMERDMSGAPAGTLAVIGLLFWLTHRRVLPLAWLLVLLLAILGGTLALGGLLIGTINVVSLGFASILVGLAEDFGIVLYEEAQSHPDAGVEQLRRAAAPGIWWSAITTAGAFLMLNLSSLPGLGQLGSLVAIGIVFAAFVMLFGFAPLVVRFRGPREHALSAPRVREHWHLFQTNKLLPARVIWGITVLVLGAAAGLLWKDGLRADHSSDPMKPKVSEAYATLDLIKTRLSRSGEPWWILVPGRTEAEVAQRLERLPARLNEAVTNRWISGFTLPTAIWPQPDNQHSNRPVLAAVLGGSEAMRRAATEAGFTGDAFRVTDHILNFWRGAMLGTNVCWPTNQASRWLLAKCAVKTPDGFLALGLIEPGTNAAIARPVAVGWQDELRREGVILSGWNLLGWSVFDLVLRELPRVMLPVLALVLCSLWLAFRNGRDVLLSLGTLLFSALCLAAVMDLLRWEWNLINVMALPLLLGMGVDFSIHMQLALRRHGGDLLAVRRSVGRALLLAGSTTVVGFGWLAFSSNAGMASLGKVCALGILLSLLVAVYLLPVWWRRCHALGRGDVPRTKRMDTSHESARSE